MRASVVIVMIVHQSLFFIKFTQLFGSKAANLRISLKSLCQNLNISQPELFYVALCHMCLQHFAISAAKYADALSGDSFWILSAHFVCVTSAEI